MIVGGVKLGLAIACLQACLPSSALSADRAPGAAVPWTTYEGEAGQTNAERLGPDYTGQTPAREASGRQCVRLHKAGDFVEIIATADAQGVVVRYSIPDSPDGRGSDATLSLFINGKKRDPLKLTSRCAHLYGEYPFKNDPAAGSPRNFWDEVRVIAGDIHAGDVIRLQKDSTDTAAEYFIDLIDLEPVASPLTKPDDALSVTDFGATPNDDTDDRPALIAAIAAAKERKKSVFIPAGRFVVRGTVEVADVTITGAGIWHTAFVGAEDYSPGHRVAFEGVGSNVTLSNFAIVGRLDYRNDSEPNDGIGGSFGTGSVLRHLWIEHTKTGGWITNSSGFVVEGCRFRNTIADGINLCIGMSNCVVRDCTTRGTGDDGFAMWPATYAKAIYPQANNRFEHCTAQLPFLAQAFSLYGGESNAVENCAAIDIPYGAGLYASTTFPTDSGFSGTTRFAGNSIVRAGGTEGAIGTCANRLDLIGLRFNDIDVIDSPNDGIKFISIKDKALRDAQFDNVRITNVGLSGKGSAIVEAEHALGTATISNVIITNAKTSPWQDEAERFELVLGEGNRGIEANSSQVNAAKTEPKNE